MESKFTPWPWKVDARTGMPLAHYGLCVSASHYSEPGITDGRDSVCDGIKGPHAEANARLIAAAPDLYAACEKIFNELDTLTGGEKSHPLANTVGVWKANLRAALARADGKKQP